MDIRANLNEPISLAPMQRCLVPTGLYIALPEGFEAQVRPRSGLAIKKGITVTERPLELDWMRIYRRMTVLYLFVV